MARRTKVALPGQSRSRTCSPACGRLAGHKGEHRATLTKVSASIVEKGVEVASADRYTVQPERPTKVATQRPAAKQRCRVSRNGQRCLRAFGHKSAGIRHNFVVVRTLRPVGPKGRDVQTVKGKTSRRGNYVASGKPSSRLA